MNVRGYIFRAKDNFSLFHNFGGTRKILLFLMRQTDAKPIKLFMNVFIRAFV